MKKFILLITVSFFITRVSAQTLTRVTLGSAASETITFLVDESVLLNITGDGKIIDFGVEYKGLTNRNINSYPLKLEKYMGRVEYYSENDNEAYRGKVKYIGRTAFTYYTADDNKDLKGKIKSINTSAFEYYGPYDEAALRGRIKSIGSTPFTYYSSFENEAYRGKLKSIGPTAITYYSSFDDKAFKGKVKSIGQASLTYYSSFERKDYSGSIKTGSYTMFVNGVYYYIRN